MKMRALQARTLISQIGWSQQPTARIGYLLHRPGPVPVRGHNTVCHRLLFVDATQSMFSQDPPVVYLRADGHGPDSFCMLPRLRSDE